MKEKEPREGAEPIPYHESRPQIQTRNCGNLYFQWPSKCAGERRALSARMGKLVTKYRPEILSWIGELSEDRWPFSGWDVHKHWSPEDRSAVALVGAAFYEECASGPRVLSPEIQQVCQRLPKSGFGLTALAAIIEHLEHGLCGVDGAIAQIGPTLPAGQAGPGEQREVTMAEFLSEYCIGPLSKNRVASIKDTLFKAARKRKKPRRKKIISLPRLTRPGGDGKKYYFLAKDLIARWPDYKDKVPGLPDLKPEFRQTVPPTPNRGTDAKTDANRENREHVLSTSSVTS